MLPPGVHAAAIVPQLKLLYNPQMKSAYNFVPGVMGLILMLICAMMTSISIEMCIRDRSSAVQLRGGRANNVVYSTIKRRSC